MDGGGPRGAFRLSDGGPDGLRWVERLFLTAGVERVSLPELLSTLA